MATRVTTKGGQGAGGPSKGGAVNFDRKGNSNKPMNGCPSKKGIDIEMNLPS